MSNPRIVGVDSHKDGCPFYWIDNANYTGGYMSYYSANKRRVNKDSVDSALAKLEALPHFTDLLTQEEGSRDRYKDRLYELNEVLSVLCNLLSAPKAETYTITESDNSYSEFNFQPDEKKFIKRFSIIYLYLQHKPKSMLESIVFEGLVSDYALMCMAVGVASGNLSNNSTAPTSEQKEATYNHLLNTYFGQTPLPRDTRKLFKLWVKGCADATIYSENSPIKVNFLQKSAIQNHGYQYVMMGNLLSLELDTPK